MSFLSTAIVWLAESALGKIVLKAAWDDLSGYLMTVIARHRQVVANKKAAEESVKPLQEAKTGDEVDAATRDALDGF